MVVVPAMLSHLESISDVVHRLELHHLANAEACTQFALLSDWADADSQHQAQDSALLSHAQTALAALNTRYPETQGQPPRFLLLHRPRSPSATQPQPTPISPLGHGWGPTRPTSSPPSRIAKQSKAWPAG